MGFLSAQSRNGIEDILKSHSTSISQDLFQIVKQKRPGQLFTEKKKWCKPLYFNFVKS